MRNAKMTFIVKRREYMNISNARKSYIMRRRE